MKNDVKPLLDELGYSIPDSVLDLQIDRVNELSDKLTPAYSNNTVKLIKIYTVCILCSMIGARKLASRSAKAGSQSFNYDDDSLRNIKASLRSLDTQGITSELIPQCNGFSTVKVVRA